ncbi:MAG: DNA adenine methylase [Glaciecola sp.]
MHKNNKNRAFLKWAGGKYSLLEHILPHLPHSPKLIEPFFGAGSVALNAEYENYQLNDINKDLVNLYKLIQGSSQAFIEELAPLFTKETNDSDFYYERRDEFNSSDDKFRRALLFVYLNRHGYNGLCRYNRKGGFNVPFGRYVKPKMPDAEIRNFATRFQKAEFTNLDYVDVIKKAPDNSVIYCDPPYIPISKTASFTQYATNGFSLEAQENLANTVKEAVASRPITVVISNHDTPLSRKLYQGAKFKSFSARRFISQNAQNRKPVKELVAIFCNKNM